MTQFLKVTAALLCIIITLVALLLGMLPTEYGGTAFEIQNEKSSDGGMKPVNKPPESRYSPDERTTPVKVLLVTLYRGGSSFLGQTFNHNPRAFYYFEPIAPIFWKAHLSESDPGMNKKFVPEDTVDHSVHEMADLLNCRLNNISNIGFVKSSKALHTWCECMRKVNKTLGTARVRESESECRDDITDICRRSDVVAVKTIRMRMYMVRRLLDIDPDINVVLYVRDPRGNIRSRRMGRDFDESPKGLASLTRLAEGLCSRISTDLGVYRELKAIRKNIWLKKYEMLAKDSVKFIQSEYKQLGIKLPATVLDYFNMSTRASKAGGRYSSVSTNSTLTAEKWRTEIPTKSQNVITATCRSVIKKLKYD